MNSVSDNCAFQYLNNVASVLGRGTSLSRMLSTWRNKTVFHTRRSTRALISVNAEGSLLCLQQQRQWRHHDSNKPLRKPLERRERHKNSARAVNSRDDEYGKSNVFTDNAQRLFGPRALGGRAACPSHCSWWNLFRQLAVCVYLERVLMPLGYV